MEGKDLAKLIEQYQHTGDQQILEAVRDACRPVVEALISELAEDSAYLCGQKAVTVFRLLSASIRPRPAFRLRPFCATRIGFIFSRF